MAQEIEYNWTNGEGNNSWYDPGNWGIDNGTTPNSVNAVVGINAGPGNVVFSAGGATSGATVLSLDVEAGAGLEIVDGFIGFAERTPARPFSLQNAGAINVTGDTASLRLKDEAHNFSGAVIRLQNGGAIDVNNGDAILNTSNVNTGNGTIEMSSDVGEPESEITGSGGAILTIDKQTILGHGNIGTNSLGLVFGSETIVNSNVSGRTMTIDGDNTTGTLNQGVLKATNGGTLDVRNNTGGLIESENGSAVTLSNNFDITGGTLRRSGTGTFTTGANGRLADLTLDVTDLTVTNAGNLTLDGAMVNQGDIAVINTTTATDIQIDESATLSGGGTVTLGGVFGATSRITDDNGGELTNIDNTIRGKGLVGNGEVQINNEAGGTIDANDSTGALELGPVSGSAMENRGLMTASNQGNLVFRSGEYDNAGGTIDVQDDSTITFNTGSNITGGTVQSLGTGSFDMAATGSFTDLTTKGTINVNNSDDLRLTGTINNLGDITVINSTTATDIQIDTAASLTGGGTITLGGAFANTSRITDDNGGGVLTNVDNTIRGQGLIGNNLVRIENLVLGTIQADQSGSTLTLDTSAATFDNFGTLSAVNNSVLDVVGTTNNFGIVDAQAGSRVEFDTLVNAMSGRLVGDGTIDVTNEIINSGKISPGNSPGTLTIDADLELIAGSLLEIELASLGMFDELIVNGDLELGGELELVLLDGYTPDETDVFDVVMANGITGFFGNIADGGRLATGDGGGFFQVNYGSGGIVQLSQFTAVPEPGAATILMAACLTLLARRRRFRENC